jgi:hypothetical protein
MPNFEVDTGRVDQRGMTPLIVSIEGCENITLDDEGYLEFVDADGQILAGFRVWAHYRRIP